MTRRLWTPQLHSCAWFPVFVKEECFLRNWQDLLGKRTHFPQYRLQVGRLRKVLKERENITLMYDVTSLQLEQELCEAALWCWPTRKTEWRKSVFFRAHCCSGLPVTLCHATRVECTCHCTPAPLPQPCVATSPTTSSALAPTARLSTSLATTINAFTSSRCVGCMCACVCVCEGKQEKGSVCVCIICVCVCVCAVHVNGI